ncbi:MAG: hypothetical protein ACI35W_03010, partial [Anaeroplasmataceae bacterium]
QEDVKYLNNHITDLKEALYGYVLDTTDIEIESTIPSTTTIDSTTYNLVDNVRGLVKEVNGNTIKSENIIVLEDVSSTTTSGITYSVSNGVITLNGTPTSNFTIYINTNEILLNGDYYLALNSTQTNIGQIYVGIKGSGVEVFEGTNTFTNNNSNIFALFIDTSISFNNVVVKPMLVKGSTAPTEFKQGFEGLKSIDYQGLKIWGKNRLDLGKIQGISNLSYFDVKGNVLTLNQDKTFSSVYWVYGGDASKAITLDNFNLKVGKNYYLFCKGNVAPLRLYFRLFDNNRTYISRSEVMLNFGDTSTKKIITAIPSNAVYVDFWIISTGSATTETTPQSWEFYLTEVEEYSPYKEPITILPFNTTLSGVNDVKDKIVISKNSDNDYYTATKIVNCESVAYTSGDEDNESYITDLTTTIKPLETPTSEVLSTTLTESDVMPLLELGGSVDIINTNNVQGSTTIEMVYKLINN